MTTHCRHSHFCSSSLKLVFRLSIAMADVTEPYEPAPEPSIEPGSADDGNPSLLAADPLVEAALTNAITGGELCRWWNETSQMRNSSMVGSVPNEELPRRNKKRCYACGKPAPYKCANIECMARSCSDHLFHNTNGPRPSTRRYCMDCLNGPYQMDDDGTGRSSKYEHSD